MESVALSLGDFGIRLNPLAWVGIDVMTTAKAIKTPYPTSEN